MKTKKTMVQRTDGRAEDEIRPVVFHKDFAKAAKGSVLVEMGRTRVLCGATVQENIPRWMQQQKVEGGWVTAEYSMLPYASSERKSRESSMGRVEGRTQEIQRLIGRSLRAVMDLKSLGRRTIWVDCDVIEADGGTRTAAVTGGYVALRLAVNRLLREGALEVDPVREAVAAVSAGVVEGAPLLDLCYTEDLAAEVDMNVVMTASNRFVEIQGTAESDPYTKTALTRMMQLAQAGIERLIEAQNRVLSGT